MQGDGPDILFLNSGSSLNKEPKPKSKKWKKLAVQSPVEDLARES